MLPDISVFSRRERFLPLGSGLSSSVTCNVSRAGGEGESPPNLSQSSVPHWSVKTFKTGGASALSSRPSTMHTGSLNLAVRSNLIPRALYFVNLEVIRAFRFSQNSCARHGGRSGFMNFGRFLNDRAKLAGARLV